MKSEDIRSNVIEVIEYYTNARRDEINDDARFVEDLGCDSLNLVEIRMDLGDRFDIAISDDEAEKYPTVGAAIAALQKALA